MLDGISCLLDFPKFSGGGSPDPLIKRIYKLNAQNLSSTTTVAEGKKEPESPPPLKQSTKNLSLGYTEIAKKEEGTGTRSFWCDL